MAGAQIMVVEDAGLVARDICNSLESLGYSVLAVVDRGEDAIEKAGQINPNLVLMDIILKGKMDGVEAADRIRSRYHIPVVYLTAMSDEQTLRRAKLTEPLGYLIKPIDTRALYATIEIALYRHEIESTLQNKNEELSALYEVARILAQPVSFVEKSRSVLNTLVRVAQADMAVMRVMDETDRGLELTVSAGSAGWEFPKTVPVDHSLSGEAFRRGKLMVTNDYATFHNADPVVAKQGAKSIVSLPLKANGQTLGVMNILSKTKDHFTPRLVSLLTAIGEGLGDL